MKNNLRWILLAALGTAVTAEATNDTSKTLVCRRNDPFVFCTQGCNETNDNVIEWTVQGTNKQATGKQQKCMFPSPVDIYAPNGSLICRGWTPIAIIGWNQYDQVCKDMYHHGGRASDWEGQGQPEDEPFSH